MMNKHEGSKRFADKSTKAAHEAIERGAWSAEEVANGAKVNLLSSFAGMRELNTKLIDMAHANTNAVFDLAHEMASAHTPSDLMAIWSAYAKRRFEMLTKQAQQLTDVGQKLASSSTEPLSRSLSEAFRHRT
jgi:phasin family protein